MKVLFVNNARSWGGAQVTLVDLVGGLRARGVDARVVARSGRPLAARLAELRHPVEPWPAGALGVPPAIGRLTALMAAGRFDVVSVEREHDLVPAGLATGLVRLAGRAPRTVVRIHHETTRILPFIRQADEVVCVSANVRARVLERYPALATRARVLHCGVPVGPPPPPEKRHRARARRFFTGRRFPIVGMVGGLQKNQEELLACVPRLARRFPEVTLAVVGGQRGDAKFQALERLVAEAGLGDQVVLTGQVPHERMPDVFFDLDLAVSTYRHDGFALVHLESLAAGTPVVAYDAGGVVELLRGRPVGVLVAGGPDDLAEAVIGLLEDDAARDAMGRAGYDLVRREFSLPAMVDRYLALFQAMTRRPAIAAQGGAR